MNIVVIESMGRYLCELYFLPEDPKPARELSRAIKQMRIIRSFPSRERGRDFTGLQKKATLLEERLLHLYWEFYFGKKLGLGIRNLFPMLLARQLSFDLLQLLSSMGLTSFDEVVPPEDDIFNSADRKRRLP